MNKLVNPFVEQRKENKMKLIDLYTKNTDMSKDKILGLFCLQTGVKLRTAMEYWKELEMAGLIMGVSKSD